MDLGERGYGKRTERSGGREGEAAVGMEYTREKFKKRGKKEGSVRINLTSSHLS